MSLDVCLSGYIPDQQSHFIINVMIQNAYNWTVVTLTDCCRGVGRGEEGKLQISLESEPSNLQRQRGETNHETSYRLWPGAEPCATVHATSSIDTGRSGIF